MTQKTIAVGTALARVDADTNFGNAQDNFTEIYEAITPIFTIGIPGKQGFGVGIFPGTLPSGMSELAGTRYIASDNYGNYKYSDGSIMCWIPAFYYLYGDGTNGEAVNVVDIKPYSYFADVAAANAAGYALHRAFYDGGVIKSGVFVDKYLCSNNAGTASSLKNGAPLSAHADHNPFSGLTGTPANIYGSAFVAAKTRGADFFPKTIYIHAALALLSLAHGQAATASTWCAWYDATGVTNFPKGNNNNALGDTNDGTVAYTTDGYPNCGLTGSGLPFAKTTHNGQACGVADLNGNLYEISPGLTCAATTKTITAATNANPCQLTITGHGMTTSAQARIASVGGMTQINDKIFVVTVVDPDTITLDGVDATGFGVYTSGGSAYYGTFNALKTSVAIKDITGGTTLATDHWGATGIAANFDPITLNFATAYPNNGFAQKYGNGAELVLPSATTGDDWLLACSGLPSPGGVSTAGSNLFGVDYFYQYVINELCPRVGGDWLRGASAGVWCLHLYDVRGYSNYGVGVRSALYVQ